MNNLRLLNTDDLFLMRLLLDGSSVTAAARQLGLTQPAVTQRIRKMERVFEVKFLERAGRGARLTDAGRAVSARAAAALDLLSEVSPGPTEQVMTVGTRPEVGMSWLFPSLAALRRSAPHLVFHCHFGSGDEILRLLGTGSLDGVLTSAPHAVRGYGALECAEERYLFVAARAVAKRIRRPADLAGEVLVEHDRSFPFQRYLDAAARAALKFKDLWFAGSTVTMTAAIVDGLGVGIVPEYLARRHVAAGRLVPILPALRLATDQFRLIYRQDRNVESAMTLLAAGLRRRGLK